MSDHRERLVAVTPYGLETVCAEEITRIGGYEIEARTGVVTYRGELYDSNIRLATAMRILRPLRDFSITSPKGLYTECKKVRWDSIITPSMTLAVDAHGNSPILRSGRYIGQVVKDAVVDSLRQSKGKRPSVDAERPDVRIHVSVHDRHVWVALDSSDPPLHKRGYRRGRVDAPLNECLGAALVRMSGFEGSGVFIDPMCGSGTIAIEAALVAEKIAPGLLRKRFGFMNWRDFDASRYERVVQGARAERRESGSAAIIAADSDPQAVAATKRNAAAAGVSLTAIHSRFEGLRRQLDLDGVDIKTAFDRILVLNPPYGERISVDDESTLYQSIGDTLKNDFAGFTAWIITASAAGRKSVGLRHSLSLPLYNGALECRLRRFELH